MYLTSLGLELLKITMLARWNCPLITHYARLAPLATLGEEFKRGTAREKDKLEDSGVKKLNLQAAKVKKHMELQIESIKEEMAIMAETVKKVELRSQPKRYLRNRTTKVIHRILIPYAEAGAGALTWCSWAYAHAKWEETHDPPTRKAEVCSDCLPDLKATLP